MKMTRIFILTLVLALCLTSASWAGFSFSNPYTQSLDAARFYAVDNLGTSGDEWVTLANISYTPIGYVLQYQYGGSSAWTTINLGDTFKINTGSDHIELVNLRLLNGTSEYRQATLTFSGQYSDGSSLYNNVSVLFTGLGLGPNVFAFASETPSGTDHVSPVPIPAAVWLFGTGLVGLVAIRRRMSA